MNREIKFRAWDGKQMTDDFAVTSRGCVIVETNPKTWDEVKDENGKMYYSDWAKYKAREDYILMQYTGLKDKHGKEIYEGDQILVKDYFPQIPHPFNGEWIEDYEDLESVVFYEDGCFMTDDSIPLFSFDESKIEVIGNIHEHPELIK